MNMESVQEKNFSPKSPGRRSLTLELLGAIIILLVVSLPRLAALDRFVTPDEPLWLTRSANFYYALGQHDLASTFQSTHPGVPVTWAGAAAFLTKFPEYRGSGAGMLETSELNRLLTRELNFPPLDLLVRARVLLVAAHVIILLLSYFYTVRLIGFLPALLAFSFIAFDPFHIAHSRLLHLDALLSNLLLLSLLSFLYFLSRRRSVHLMVSAAAAGFSWLTKTPGLFLLPVVVLLSVIHTIQKHGRSLNTSWIETIWQILKPILIWGTFACLIYFIFWPSMWVQPLAILKAIFMDTIVYAEGGHETAVFFNGQIAADGSLGWKYFYFYPLTYLWRSTPLALLGLLLVLLGFILKWKPFDQPTVKMTVFGLVLFVIIFTVGVTISDKKFDRYLLPVYAPLDILSALGWMGAVYRLQSSRLPIGAERILYAIFAVVVGLQIYSAISVHPYYLPYYNPLLGGSSKAGQVMQIGWGEGLDQAARYLNQKENAEDLHVMSWYAVGPFSYYFKGHSRNMSLFATQEIQDWKAFRTADYVVIYTHQWQRNLPQNALEFVSGLTPEHTVTINGIDYARVYKLPPQTSQ